MVHEGLTWWAGQLQSLLPGSLQHALAGSSGDGLVIAVRDMPDAGRPTVELFSRRKAVDGLRGRFVLDAAGVAALRAAVPVRSPVRLGLPADMLLEQRVTLPLAAERDAARVLAYEMDRLTPFAADDIYWAWVLDRRDRANGHVHFRLSLVPKARLAPLLAALAAAGIHPSGIEAATPDGSYRRLSLERVRTPGWRRRGAGMLGAACAGLALAVAAMPFVAQSLAAHRTEAQIAALRPRVDRAEALRRAIARGSASADMVGVQRARVGDALDVLTTVTDGLPDDTYLTELTLHSRVLTLNGQSAAAARLIPALAAAPSLRNPAFTAPVLRGEAGRGEGFSIRAEVVR